MRNSLRVLVSVAMIVLLALLAVCALAAMRRFFSPTDLIRALADTIVVTIKEFPNDIPFILNALFELVAFLMAFGEGIAKGFMEILEWSIGLWKRGKWERPPIDEERRRQPSFLLVLGFGIFCLIGLSAMRSWRGQ